MASPAAKSGRFKPNRSERARPPETEERIMTKGNSKRGRIGILTGGGDVPGLNPAIRAVTMRAIHEGYEVIGIRRGWAGLVDMNRDKGCEDSEHVQILTEEMVNRIGRTGGTFLHTSRTRPSHVPDVNVPEHLRDRYTGSTNDLTEESSRTWTAWASTP
jgi:hypothetical protein